MPAKLSPTIWAHHRLDWGQRTYVMGNINVTPDSFAGDGLAAESLPPEVIVERGVAQARGFVKEGATMIEVGGGSTTPHALPVSVEPEVARVIPAVRAL